MASTTQTPSEALSCAIATMRNAIDLLEMKVSTSMPLEDAEVLFKGFHEHVLIGVAGAVDAVGGDALYVPAPDYLSDDISTAFEVAMREEELNAPNYTRPYSTLSHELQGIAR